MKLMQPEIPAQKPTGEQIPPSPAPLVSGLKTTETSPGQMHTASLAFLGDAVYSLLVRERLAALYGKAEDLHTRAVGFVSARAQAESAKKLLPHLTEEELALFKRGRNMQTAHKPKGVTDAEYHSATGLETLFGYLYLSGEFARLHALFAIAVS
ncbi:MAG: ribonuclease III [Oscillospiraceae bacterium]|nr:ribonuclease III [Oscillospiraceae bacterium]